MVVMNLFKSAPDDLVNYSFHSPEVMSLVAKRLDTIFEASEHPEEWMRTAKDKSKTFHVIPEAADPLRELPLPTDAPEASTSA